MKLLLTHLFLLPLLPDSHSPLLTSFAHFLSCFLSLSGFRSCRKLDSSTVYVVSETLWPVEDYKTRHFIIRNFARFRGIRDRLLQRPRFSTRVCGTSPIHHGHLRRKCCPRADCNFECNKAVLVEPRNKLP